MDKFIEARRAYQILQIKYSSGKLDKLTFQQAAEELAVKDQFGDMWQIGVLSGNWYRFDGRQWVEDYPPPSDLVSEASPVPIVPDAADFSLPQSEATVIDLHPANNEIIVLNGELEYQRFPVDDQLCLGRETDNDLTLPDEKASRHHAILQRQGMVYQIIDMNSGNGTYVNGKRISQPTVLKDGDIILIGTTRISFNSLA